MIPVATVQSLHYSVRLEVASGHYVWEEGVQIMAAHEASKQTGVTIPPGALSQPRLVGRRAEGGRTTSRLYEWAGVVPAPITERTIL